MTATSTKWYEENGRYEIIIAGGKAVNLPSKDHKLVLRADDVAHGLQHDLDDQGIAKTAREEKKRARDARQKEEENARMMKLYREQVLKEAPGPELVKISGIMPAAAPKPAPKTADVSDEVGSFGD